METREPKKSFENARARKAFVKPTLQAYDQGTLRAKTAQVTQKGVGVSPINPLGMQMGGS